MKAILHYRASPGFAAQLQRAAPAWLKTQIIEETDPTSFGREMADTEVLLHVLEPVTRAVIEGAPRLKLVQKLGVGVNTIDLEAARERGVAVANMPGTNSQAVAETTLLLMLAALRRVRYFDRAIREGRGWSVDPAVLDRVGELAGCCVGLVGYGAVASLLAPVLSSLGAQIRYTATAPKPRALGEWRSLEALLAECDLVSLHLPLTSETDKLLNRKTLALMKLGSVLVNTARGGLVDEAALIEALESGQLGAAGLDVFASEPIEPDNRLLQLDNVTLMPHIAWLTPETLDRSLDVAIENCRRIREGTELLHRVV